MNCMTFEDWKVYAIYRQFDRKKADTWKSEMKKKRKLSAHCENEWQTVFSDDYGFTKKRFFPYFFTTEEWEEFCDCEWINIYSPYDCTGMVFSRDLTQHRTKNGTWVYHSLSLDI